MTASGVPWRRARAISSARRSRIAPWFRQPGERVDRGGQPGVAQRERRAAPGRSARWRCAGRPRPTARGVREPSEHDGAHRVAGGQRQHRGGRQPVGCARARRAARRRRRASGDRGRLAGLGDPAQRVRDLVAVQDVLGRRRRRAARRRRGPGGPAASTMTCAWSIAEDGDELLAEGALDRRQARVALGETREPLDALQEPLHPVLFRSLRPRRWSSRSSVPGRRPAGSEQSRSGASCVEGEVPPLWPGRRRVRGSARTGRRRR